MSTANVSQRPLISSHPCSPSEDALFVLSSVPGRSGGDAPAPGLRLWTQGCGGGAAEGKMRTLGVPRPCWKDSVVFWPFLQAGAGVHVQDNAGDTPLHKAARAGRKVAPRFTITSHTFSSTVVIKGGVFVTGFPFEVRLLLILSFGS